MDLDLAGREVGVSELWEVVVIYIGCHVQCDSTFAKCRIKQVASGGQVLDLAESRILVFGFTCNCRYYDFELAIRQVWVLL